MQMGTSPALEIILTTRFDYSPASEVSKTQRDD